MKLLIGVLITLTAGCATGVSKAFKKSGVQIYEAKCNGVSRSIALCYSQASEKCGGSFKEFGKDKTSSFVPVNGMIAPVSKKSLLFYCE